METGTSDTGGQGGGDDELAMKPAAIVDLFKELPNKGDQFLDEERELWLTALKANLNFVYGKPKTTATDNGQHRPPISATDG